MRELCFLILCIACGRVLASGRLDENGFPVLESHPEWHAEYDAALLKAQMYDHLKLVGALLEDGANPNATNSNGEGILHLFLRRGGEWSPQPSGTGNYRQMHFDHLRSILAKGADPNIANHRGVTPLMLASRLADQEVAETLKVAGAKQFDEKDPKVQAILVRLDAEILTDALKWCFMEVGATQCHTGDTADKIGVYLSRSGKVGANRGRDVLGNFYIVEGDDDHIGVIHVNPATAKALRSAVKPDYWKPYNPLEGKPNK
jgi:hypothetical protein